MHMWEYYTYIYEDDDGDDIEAHTPSIVFRFT